MLKSLGISLVSALIAASAHAHDVNIVKNETVRFSGVDKTDQVQLVRANGTPGMVSICLQAGPNVTWWKTLEVWAGPNRRLGKLETKDGNRGPYCLSYDTNEFAPKYARIELRKAKALGAPSGPAFKAFSPWAYHGKKFTVNWIKD
ncbi:MAG: hypothetical protein AAGB10_21340 [Pseudomonadota bacterium]